MTTRGPPGTVKASQNRAWEICQLKVLRSIITQKENVCGNNKQKKKGKKTKQKQKVEFVSQDLQDW